MDPTAFWADQAKTVSKYAVSAIAAMVTLTAILMLQVGNFAIRHEYDRHRLSVLESKAKLVDRSVEPLYLSLKNPGFTSDEINDFIEIIDRNNRGNRKQILIFDAKDGQSGKSTQTFYSLSQRYLPIVRSYKNCFVAATQAGGKANEFEQLTILEKDALLRFATEHAKLVEKPDFIELFSKYKAFALQLEWDLPNYEKAHGRRRPSFHDFTKIDGNPFLSSNLSADSEIRLPGSYRQTPYGWKDDAMKGASIYQRIADERKSIADDGLHEVLPVAKLPVVGIDVPVLFSSVTFGSLMIFWLACLYFLVSRFEIFINNLVSMGADEKSRAALCANFPLISDRQPILCFGRVVLMIVPLVVAIFCDFLTELLTNGNLNFGSGASPAIAITEPIGCVLAIAISMIVIALTLLISARCAKIGEANGAGCDLFIPVADFQKYSACSRCCCVKKPIANPKPSE